MPYLVFRHNGVPVLAISEGEYADIGMHIAAYPDIRDEYAAGNIAVDKVESLDGITIQQMPVTAGRLVERGALLKILADHEARILALEGGKSGAADAGIESLRAIVAATREVARG